MSAENHQTRPLAPPKIYGRSDEELVPVFKPRPPSSSRGRCSSKCPVYFLAVVVVLAAIALVFSMIVLRPANPEFALRDVSVKFLNYTSDDQAPWLSARLAVRATLKNPNFGPFEFKSSNLTVSYYGTVVGEKALGDGTVWSRETRHVDVTVAVGPSRVAYLKNLSSDMGGKVLELTSYAKLSGRVHLIKIVKRRLTSVLNCTMSVGLSNRRVQDLKCR
ncbi:late embryogenesis abundant protein At1g64065-like [Rhodamnia argentea]|uniref:Late embryogenesis abundant protein At1g64065-like n=1 Tax=Rhodamnia argentea TaxID=178133 RepID=A0A8B8QR36_9MYRT|nr:late embryogenesis abundant protein At1g64065-like [Rhodamnia argentea]